MELRESIESINKKLLEEYGTEFTTSPRFRVVFSEDQYEKRLTDFTDEGFELDEEMYIACAIINESLYDKNADKKKVVGFN